MHFQSIANPKIKLYCSLTINFCIPWFSNIKIIPVPVPNLYGLHLLCKQKVLGIEKVLDQLSRQFEDCGIQNLQADQLKILRDSLNKRVSNITLSFNENSCDMDINWGKE